VFVRGCLRFLDFSSVTCGAHKLCFCRRRLNLFGRASVELNVGVFLLVEPFWTFGLLEFMYLKLVTKKILVC